MRLAARFRRWWYRSALKAALDCRRGRCTYYNHYLRCGPAELTHPGYHAAEQECRAWQQRLSEWWELHAHDDVPEPAYLARQCALWEKKVRA